MRIDFVHLRKIPRFATARFPSKGVVTIKRLLILMLFAALLMLTACTSQKATVAGAVPAASLSPVSGQAQPAIYTNNELLFSFVIPETWNASDYKTVVTHDKDQFTGGDYTTVRFLFHGDAEGCLYELTAMPLATWRTFAMNSPMSVLGKRGDLVFSAATTAENPYTGDKAEQFQTMKSAVETEAADDSAFFLTDGEEPFDLTGTVKDAAMHSLLFNTDNGKVLSFGLTGSEDTTGLTQGLLINERLTLRCLGTIKDTDTGNTILVSISGDGKCEVTGTVEDATMRGFSLSTADGDHYAFITDDQTDVSGIPGGLSIGQSVKVVYTVDSSGNTAALSIQEPDTLRAAYAAPAAGTSSQVFGRTNGTVKDASMHSLTIVSGDGQERTFSVTDKTDRTGLTTGLTIGGQVVVEFRADAENEASAEALLIEDAVPADLTGTVTDAGNQTVSILNDDGTIYTFSFLDDGATDFSGLKQGLSIGKKITVTYTGALDGELSQCLAISIKDAQ